MGTDLENQFGSALTLCPWAAIVPGHNESAGKRKSPKSKKGNKYLKSALTEAAHSEGASTTMEQCIDEQQHEKVKEEQE
ncbi:transposase [Gottfriedia acidiceleris]|uniref:transposase n=1 Tax=Gottfriedia acidiceleris TaxID=371036 RepID=UPI003D7F3902